MMTITYKGRNSIYVNMTNRCPCSCTFCLRQTRDRMEDSDPLWLEHEPAYDEVIAEFAKWNVEEYDEVVFCGFGEPTERLDVLLKVAEWIKDKINSLKNKEGVNVGYGYNVFSKIKCWFSRD